MARPLSARNVDKRRFGIQLEQPVIDYLDRIAMEEERSWNNVISRIIREHAEQNGTPIAFDEPNGRKGGTAASVADML